MAVDQSDLISNDTKAIIDAIEGNDAYASTDSQLYKTDVYSGTDDDVANTEKFTSDIDLTVNSQAAIDIKFDGDNGTDDLTVNLYARRDASWDGDEIAQLSITVSNDGSEDIYHYKITKAMGTGHYRLGLVSAGATTTFDIDAQMRTSR